MFVKFLQSYGFYVTEKYHSFSLFLPYYYFWVEVIVIVTQNFQHNNKIMSNVQEKQKQRNNNKNKLPQMNTNTNMLLPMEKCNFLFI